MKTEFDFEDETQDQTTGQVMPPEEDAPTSMPLGIGGDAPLGESPLGLESSSGAKPNTGKTQSALIMLLVLIVAGGTLWTMRVTGGVEKMDSSVSVAEQKIEQALAKLKGESKDSPLEQDNLNELFGDTEQVVAIFEDDPTKKQINVDNLSKNPFELVVTNKKDDQTETVSAIDRLKDERNKELKRELGKLELQSVLSGATPLAVISGKVVRVGDTIGSFDVVGITQTGVKLSAESNRYTLSMQQPSDKISK